MSPVPALEGADVWGGPLRIAVLVKQVPLTESMGLMADGRLDRNGDLEMNAYCRRAVSKGVEMARASGGTCTVVSLGPLTAVDVLREAIAWGADFGVLITDPVLAGSDTLATARALCAALEREGPFDLVLAGRNSIDADTGQVGPQVAELLGLPFAAGVRSLRVEGSVLEVASELDDGWRHLRVHLPAVVSVAERLTEPCKVQPDGRAAVPAHRIRSLGAAELGPGLWGAAGSPTRVGSVRRHEVHRHRLVLEGTPSEMAEEAARLLGEWGARGVRADGTGRVVGRPGTGVLTVVPASMRPAGGTLAVVVEPGRPGVAREILGEAAHLAAVVGATVVAIGPGGGRGEDQALDPAVAGGWGADRLVHLDGGSIEEDVAAGLAQWSRAEVPWAVLAPGTLWGREVAARAAAALGAGLTGDAVSFDVDRGRLVAWKPAFGGQLVAAVTSSSTVQMATVRPGVLPLRAPRPCPPVPRTAHPGVSRGRVEVLGEGRDDDVDVLLSARAVVSVGAGVDPAAYSLLGPLVRALGAEMAATRKVTDKGWLPRSRQIGITGHSVAPDLAVTVGASGKFNHMVGFRSARVVVAVNRDPAAPVFEGCDIGLVGEWQEVVPHLAAALARQGAARPAAAGRLREG